MLHLLSSLIDLNEAGFQLWLEGGRIKYRISRPCDNKEQWIIWLTQHKKELLDFLEFNKIYQSEYPLPFVYKLPLEQYPLSFAQERLRFIDKYEEGTAVYNIPMSFRFKVSVNEEALKATLVAIVRRHELLHSVIKEDQEGKACQVTGDMDLLSVKKINTKTIRGLKESFSFESQQQFDLSSDFPIRFRLYHVESTNEDYLLLLAHHIAFDGWSVDIFLREFDVFYGHYTARRTLELPILSVNYKDFSLWQRHYLQGERLERELNFWRSHLDNYEPLNLVTDMPRPIQINYRGADLFFEVDESCSKGLRRLAQHCSVSLFSVLLAAFYLLLRVQGHQDDLVIGTPVANRHYPQIEGLIGFFINSLALRIRVDSQRSILNFIKQVGESVIQSQLHQDLPFERLVEALCVGKDSSRHPIFQVVFSVQHFGRFSSPTSIIEQYDEGIEQKFAKFDLSAVIDDNDSILKGWFNYSTSLFKQSSIESIVSIYKYILLKFVSLFDAGNLNNNRIADLTYYDDINYHQGRIKADESGSSFLKSVPLADAINQENVRSCHVLNVDLKPVPIGAVGELYLDLRGLSEKSSLKLAPSSFPSIKNPFCDGFLYKTGRLVRRLNEGEYIYLGVIEDQIKIRGYRIELAAIEHALLQHGQIKKAKILIKQKKDNTNNNIVAYYLADQVLDDSELFVFLSTRLPPHMHPSMFIHLKEFPSVGEGDCYLYDKLFPEPVWEKIEGVELPRNSLEEQVHRIWSDVLRLRTDEFGIDSDFFRLGGDSIICIQLISRLRHQLSISVKVKAIFTYRSIRALSDAGELKPAGQTDTLLSAEQGVLVGKFDLLPIQRWFFKKVLQKANHWNQSFVARVPAIEFAQLKKAVQQLLQYHDALRLEFYSDVEGECQFYGSARDVMVHELNVTELAVPEESFEFKNRIDRILTDWQGCFDLKGGRICCFGYIHGYKNGGARVFFACHHLAVDSVSWQIILSDLEALYYGRSLPVKTSSYRQWSNLLRGYAASHDAEVSYWKAVLAEYGHWGDTWKMVCENPQEICRFDLSKELTEALLRQVNHAFNTQINDVLLAAFGQALYQVTGKEKHFITMESHGRELGDADVDVGRTVGWFTTLYPFCINVLETPRLNLIRTKEALRKIPNKGLGYGILLGYTELPNIYFNYLGQLDTKNSLSAQSAWQIVEETSGINIAPENQQEAILTVTAFVLNNQLHVQFRAHMSHESLSQLSNVFYQKIADLICFLKAFTRAYLTESDVHYIVNQGLLDELQGVEEAEAIYKANSLQQGFVFHALTQSDRDDAYLVQTCWQYHRMIAVDTLKQAWKIAIQSYPALRLRFAWSDSIVQVVNRNVVLNWYYEDFSTYSPAVQSERIALLKTNDRLARFNLNQAGLYRIHLIRQSPTLHTCLFSNHHIVLDGWSTALLLASVHKVYLALINGQVPLYQVDYCYGEAQVYIEAQQQQDMSFWNAYLANLSDRVDLSGLLKPESKGVNIVEYKFVHEQKEQVITFSKEIIKQLRSIIQGRGVTLNTALQFVWHLVLKLYGNAEQTIVGMTVSGRHLPIANIETSIGLYINTLPSIFNHTLDQSIESALCTLQQTITTVNSHGHQYLAGLQKQGERLFDSLFVYENYPDVSDTIAEQELGFVYQDCVEKLDYPLNVIVNENSQGLRIRLKYAGDLFSDETICSLLESLKTIFEQISENIDKPVQQLQYLNARQYQQIIYDWNATRQLYEYNKTIHALFEDQVRKTPELPAVIYQDVCLTYRELNQRANQLAHYLQAHYCTEPDTLIAVCLDRSEYMLIALLAIIKSGAAYVPIDPHFPQDRIVFLLQDTQAALLLTEISHAQFLRTLISEALLNCPVDCLAIDEPINIKKVSQCSSDNPYSLATSRNLAYVIYTSGTTGKPKGVMSEHRGVINLISWMQKHYPLTHEDRLLQKTTYVFDDSVYELFWPNWYGACIVFATPEGHKDPHYLIQLMHRAKITITSFVPSLLGVFIEAMRGFSHNLGLGAIPSLKYVLCSGEALPLLQVQQLQKLLPRALIHNLYGPTEASVDVLYYNCTEPNITRVLIGKPIQNTTAYIVDRDMRPLPVGAVGELLIGGDNLSRGYFNRPELTSEKFVTNPFQTKSERLEEKNNRLYKTGDLVRYLMDGNIDYCGRNDFQIKIRGFRIELGEIESAMLRFEGISQAVALVAETPGDSFGTNVGKFLVGYYVAPVRVDEKLLEEFLKKNLPEYMLPKSLVHLTFLPVTVSGKLDRRALPSPQLTMAEVYREPGNEIEFKLQSIWAKILSLELKQVSVDSDFFSLGGNSILSIVLLNQINRTFSLQLLLASLFLSSERTIFAMSNIIQHAIGESGIHKNDYEELFDV